MANNPFGVLEFLHWNHPWNQYKFATPRDIEKAVALMQEAGIGWLRTDFLWEEIEAREGNFDFAKYDGIVEAVKAKDIQILGLLTYCAPWASVSGKWNAAPKDYTAFLNYATRVVRRYQDRVKYWEVWNEPDSPVYWEPQDDLKSYCALLPRVYAALKKIDPECKILNGGLANGIASVNKLYDNGARDYFDILNIHIFESALHAGAIERVAAYPELAYEIMARHGDSRKKIWVTEIGCPGVKAGLKIDDWWLGKNPDEERQAEWLKKAYPELLRAKAVEKIFWAYFRDCKAHWNNGVDYFGLVRWDYSKKPAFFAYRKCFENWKKSK